MLNQLYPCSIVFFSLLFFSLHFLLFSYECQMSFVFACSYVENFWTVSPELLFVWKLTDEGNSDITNWRTGAQCARFKFYTKDTHRNNIRSNSGAKKHCKNRVKTTQLRWEMGEKFNITTHFFTLQRRSLHWTQLIKSEYCPINVHEAAAYTHIFCARVCVSVCVCVSISVFHSAVLCCCECGISSQRYGYWLVNRMK